MDKYILAGVGTIEAFTQSSTSPQKIFTSQTLQESGLTTSVTAEDIRGGLSNPLLGRYFHDSVLEANITDALFDMTYIALNVGGEIVVGGDTLKTESIKVTTANTITVEGTPVAFGDAGTVGWYTIQGQEDWKPITFVGKTATVTSGLPVDTDICVRYNTQIDSLKKFVIPSSVIPSEVHLIMTYPLFAAGSDTQSLSTSSQVGELIVDIPRFQFAGNVELSLNSSGAATSNLSGSALAKYTTQNCNDMGMYATVKMNIFGGNWYDDLVSMAVEDAEFSIEEGGTKTLRVIGIFSSGGTTMTGILDNANLIFTSKDTTYATVGERTGVVTGASAGEADIEIKVADKTSVACYAEVTVTSV